MRREVEIKKIASAFAIDEVKDTCNPASKRGLLYAGFVSGAEWADAHPHWISIDDELPPCNVFVLTCDEQENENLLMLGGNGRWYDKAVGFHRNITHWMPMPPPPHHIIDANKKVDRVIGTADHIKTALDVLNKKGGEE